MEDKSIGYPLALRISKLFGLNVDKKAAELLALARSKGKNKITASLLAPEFNAKSAKRVTEVISESNIVVHDGKKYLEISDSLFDELQELLSAYKDAYPPNEPPQETVCTDNSP